jgi:DNA-binding response OmpR family regulator
VLVAEDQPLLALGLAMTLEQAGCAVIGPALSLDAARRCMDGSGLDAAVLDVHLGDANSFPIADELAARRVPVVFLTGYDATILPDRFRGCALQQKPYSCHLLLMALRSALGR